MAKKILIIDDEEDMRVYLETLFKKAGFETDTAVNGDEAGAKLDSFQPDLITLDILMPRKSGLNLFQWLRKNQSTKNLPIVVLSGLSGHKDFFDGESQKGPTIFVDKPIEPDSFLENVRQMLGGE
jgi:two-component system alkaline phosphatase synthesis response regulator PhoP